MFVVIAFVVVTDDDIRNHSRLQLERQLVNSVSRVLQSERAEREDTDVLEPRDHFDIPH